MRPNYTTHSDSPFQTFIFLDLWKQHHPHLRKKPESTGRTNDTWQRWSSSNVVFNLQITWTLKHHFLHLMQMYDALRFWGFAYSRLLSIVSCLSWYLAILVPSRVNKYFFMVSSSKKPYWSVSYWSASWNPVLALLVVDGCQLQRLLGVLDHDVGFPSPQKGNLRQGPPQPHVVKCTRPPAWVPSYLHLKHGAPCTH